MKVKMIVVAVLVIGLAVGAYFFGSYHATHASDALAPCVAGPNELCPNDDFRQEIVTAKALQKQYQMLSQDPKVKQLIALGDQIDGMSRRMQAQITQTLNSNPGHQWDGQKEKFTPAPILQPTAAAPPSVPAKK